MENYRFLLQHELIHAVEKHPKKTALIIEGFHISYEQVLNDVLKLASCFYENNVRRGDRVLIASGNSYLTVVSYFAAIFCDSVACIVDESFSKNIIEKLFDSLKPCIVIAKDNRLFINYVNEKNIIFLDNILSGKNGFEIEFRNTEQDLAMIMHTSGSTGIPKGVMLSHRNILSALHAIDSYLSLKSSDIIFSVLPLHFDYGLYQVFLSILAGATLVLEKNAFLANIISKKICKYKVTVIPCVPHLVQLIYSYKKESNYNLVRIITNTGENLTEKQIEKIRKTFPVADIFSMYGLTECKRCSYVPPKMLNQKIGSIGIPMPNLEMWIEDEEGNVLDPNNEGCLVVSGPSIMIGYWQNKQATDKKIRFSKSGKKTLLTGDRAIMDEEGYFYFRGRKDGVIKFKGMKLYPQNYIRKINEINGVNRSFLFLKEGILIACVEIEDCDNDFLRLDIMSLFPEEQKPSFLYLLKKFPLLSNGKCDLKTLEDMAINFHAGLMKK